MIRKINNLVRGNYIIIGTVYSGLPVPVTELNAFSYMLLLPQHP